MHPNAELLQTFYTAFSSRDTGPMAAAYHPEAHFSDPVFDLRGERIGHMWTMLCHRGKDMEMTFSGVEADDHTGRVHWEATYTFSGSGRKVHNIINATFRFQDGKIIEHTDVFNLWRWTRMALGPTGWLLGWTPMVQNKIRAQGAQSLDAWIAKQQG